jgi:hypothetical protein
MSDNPHDPFHVPKDGYVGAQSVDGMVPLFIPSLISVLLNREKAKGAPLTESEVLGFRDAATCVMTPVDTAAHVTDVRGYADIDPSNCWDEFLKFKASEE